MLPHIATHYTYICTHEGFVRCGHRDMLGARHAWACRMPSPSHARLVHPSLLHPSRVHWHGLGHARWPRRAWAASQACMRVCCVLHAQALRGP
jgi:hypothetical protein